MPHGIYPVDLADRCKADAGKPWQPSNGTEGGFFIESWCGECRRDKVANGEVHPNHATEDDYCPVLVASFGGEAIEWQYDTGGQPCCTKFSPKRDPVPDRCPHTMELPL